MSTLYLLKYNNYYNRQVKSTNLAGYMDYVVGEVENVNFNPDDGVNTTHTVNISDTIQIDYVLITKINPASLNEVIDSRWFVTDRKQTRRGQSVLTLRRDVAVDYDKALREAKVYLDRGYVNANSPLIYNSEGNSYNQIKTSETLLKDKSNTPWLVAYLAQNFFVDEDDTSSDKDIAITKQQNYDMTFATLTELWLAVPNSQNQWVPYTFSGYSFSVDTIPTVSYADNYVWKITNQDVTYTETQRDESAAWEMSGDINQGSLNTTRSELAVYSPSLTIMSTDMKKDHPDFLISNYRQLISLSNAIARVGSGSNYRYYQMRIQRDFDGLYTVQTNADDEVNKTINAMLGKTSFIYPRAGKDHTHEVTMNYGRIKAQWVDVTEDVIVTLKAESTLLRNAPYYMVCMPYSDVTLIHEGTNYANDTSLPLPIMQQLIKDYGSFVYDVQLLPYCPLQSIITNTGINLDALPGQNVSVTTTTNGAVTMIFCPESSFSFDIERTIALKENVKVQNETEFARLNSPNYASSFDFSVAKNYGVSYFSVDCTYKPYSPYIHIAPDWDNMYGQDFDDARGLICSGDFSIDIISDAWTQYKLSNKNYQEIFNRQIDTFDYNVKYQKIQEGVGAVTGAISAGLGAGVNVGAFGGPVAGAIVGGASGAASLAGGIADTYINNQLRTRQREDMVVNNSLQIGNIKAMPNTLTKVSAINANNKIYPFLEIYSATTAEISALENYLSLYSYSLGVVGTITEYLNPNAETFVKGNIIRIDLHEDNHMLETLNNELQRGLYYPAKGGN